MDQETILALASTIYFRAKWDGEFSEANTAPDTFHADSGAHGNPNRRTDGHAHSGTNGDTYGSSHSRTDCRADRNPKPDEPPQNRR